ncbi:putative integral membrane protein [Neofusicoccum parvum UCRNP2]|uniref:Putative integral membrane protein n=1 Tax=Botryosphaeria parva (strain UCR-NP2) TaxID=1287680 RepID=R1EJA4_BOTPV|nr:putative integral membrane protein [Neofusicoccum parvum UCRNP2]
MDPELDRRLTQKFTHVPSARGNQLFVFNIASLVIIWISVFLRVYVRSRVLKSWGLDDYLMIAALLCFSWMSGAMIALVYCGFGKHMMSIPPEWIMNGFKAYLLAQLGYIMSVLFMKLSVCAFYLRITILRWQAWTVYVLMGINIVYTIGYFILILNQCAPVSYLWNQLAGAKGHCLSINVILGTSYTHNTISILSDWVLATMPLFMLKDSKLNRRTKAIVLFLLGLGYFASVSSMIRMNALPTLRRTDDYTFTVIPIAFWSAVETAVGILAANLATYRPLFSSLVDRVTSSGSGSGGKYSSRLAAWSLGRRAREHGYIMSGEGHDLKSLKTEEGSTGARGPLPHTTSTATAGLAFPAVRNVSDEELGILKQTDVTVEAERG